MREVHLFDPLASLVGHAIDHAHRRPLSVCLALSVHPSAAFTRSGWNGRSRRRLPVACANALAIAATAGPCDASPAPSERSFGWSISTTSTFGTSGMVRIG